MAVLKLLLLSSNSKQDAKVFPYFKVLYRVSEIALDAIGYNFAMEELNNLNKSIFILYE